MEDTAASHTEWEGRSPQLSVHRKQLQVQPPPHPSPARLSPPSAPPHPPGSGARTSHRASCPRRGQQTHRGCGHREPHSGPRASALNATVSQPLTACPRGASVSTTEKQGPGPDQWPSVCSLRFQGPGAPDQVSENSGRVVHGYKAETRARLAGPAPNVISVCS